MAQHNGKIGPALFQADSCQVPAAQRDDICRAGADVTHPMPGSEEPSVAAVVASLDEHAARYAAQIRLQGRGTEMIQVVTNRSFFKIKIQMIGNLKRQTY